MSPKILRRCSICKKFHASYRVEHPQLGVLHLCTTCWSTTQAASTPPEAPAPAQTDTSPPATGPSADKSSPPHRQKVGDDKVV